MIMSIAEILPGTLGHSPPGWETVVKGNNCIFFHMASINFWYTKPKNFVTLPSLNGDKVVKKSENLNFFFTFEILFLLTASF